MCCVHTHTIACILGISMLHVPSQVEVKGLIYTGTLESSQQSQVSVLVNQLDQNFTKGENHTVRVFVTNSVGTSNPLPTLLRVPCELPNILPCESLSSCMYHSQLLMSTLSSPSYPLVPPVITAPPTELSNTNIPVCCAGVQLNLANPEDPIDVRVLVDGTLHPANQVVREGSFLYIMGLQAGTEYSLNITLFNIFGTVWVNTTVRPLLGELVDHWVISVYTYVSWYKFLPRPKVK